GIGATGLYAAVVTAGIFLLINLFVPIRVPSHAEERGLDLTQHGEAAYGRP
ncbi:MAG: ammonia channel protein, partial [Chloroflexi bacterium]|nr:ammonia channel protein [Chloroflexota bacterium]